MSFFVIKLSGRGLGIQVECLHSIREDLVLINNTTNITKYPTGLEAKTESVSCTFSTLWRLPSIKWVD